MSGTSLNTDQTVAYLLGCNLGLHKLLSVLKEVCLTLGRAGNRVDHLAAFARLVFLRLGLELLSSLSGLLSPHLGPARGELAEFSFAWDDFNGLSLGLVEHLFVRNLQVWVNDRFPNGKVVR